MRTWNSPPLSLYCRRRGTQNLRHVSHIFSSKICVADSFDPSNSHPDISHFRVIYSLRIRCVKAWRLKKHHVHSHHVFLGRKHRTLIRLTGLFLFSKPRSLRNVCCSKATSSRSTCDLSSDTPVWARHWLFKTGKTRDMIMHAGWEMFCLKVHLFASHHSFFNFPKSFLLFGSLEWKSLSLEN